MLVRLDILTVEDLSAYVDGEVDEETARSVDGAIRSDDRAAAMVCAFRQQIANLHRLHDGHGLDKVPPRLADLMERHRCAEADDTPKGG